VEAVGLLLGNGLQSHCEALGQLGQDEPASGRPSEFRSGWCWNDQDLGIDA